MIEPMPNNLDDQRDRATADRLARLRTMPVDTTTLDRLLAVKLPPPPSQRRAGRMGWLRSTRSLRAMAASVLIMALVGGLVWTTAAQPVMASAADMVRIHRQMVDDPSDMHKVDSIQEASEVLSGKWPHNPGLPRSIDSDIMACCMHSIKDRKMACVLFKNQGRPVTLSVARSSDLRSPQSPTLTRDGQAYHVESAGALNMVSTQRDGRWICLMGELPVDQLIEIAYGLRF